MIQDESVSMPNRRTTGMDNAERVHAELSHQGVTANISASVPIRREGMCFC
jgi:hypothetical protein